MNPFLTVRPAAGAPAVGKVRMERQNERTHTRILAAPGMAARGHVREFVVGSLPDRAAACLTVGGHGPSAAASLCGLGLRSRGKGAIKCPRPSLIFPPRCLPA